MIPKNKELIIVRSGESEFRLSWYGFCRRAYEYMRNAQCQKIEVSLMNTMVIDSYNVLNDLLDLFIEAGYRVGKRATEALYLLHEKEMPSTSIKPRDYQVADAATILSRKHVLLASTAGTGKTLVAIIAASCLFGRKIVVCPASILYNWEREIKRYLPHSSVTIQPKGPPYGEYVLVSYDFLSEHLNEMPRAQMVILDEAHIIRKTDPNGEPSTQRGRACMTLLEGIEYRLLLTATPSPSYRRELYVLLQALRAFDITGNNYDVFRKRYCSRINQSGATDYNGKSDSKLFHSKLSKYVIRRQGSDVLPNIKKQRYYIPIDSIKHSSPVSNLEGFTKARISCSLRKVTTTTNLVDALFTPGHPIICFSCYLEVLESVQATLQHRQITAEILCGKLSLVQRDTIISKFNKGSIDVLLISFSMGAVGLNLQRASITILNDVSFVVGDWIQAEARTARIGQNSLCQYYYLYDPNDYTDTRLINIISDKIDSISADTAAEELKEIEKEIKKIIHD